MPCVCVCATADVVSASSSPRGWITLQHTHTKDSLEWLGTFSRRVFFFRFFQPYTIRTTAASTTLSTAPAATATFEAIHLVGLSKRLFFFFFVFGFIFQQKGWAFLDFLKTLKRVKRLFNRSLRNAPSTWPSRPRADRPTVRTKPLVFVFTKEANSASSRWHFMTRILIIFNKCVNVLLLCVALFSSRKLEREIERNRRRISFFFGFCYFEL